MPPNDLVKGCELIFPDTVFFENGEPKLLIKMEKENMCIQGIRNPAKLNLQNIQNEFLDTFKERKKETHGIFHKRYGPSIVKP